MDGVNQLKRVVPDCACLFRVPEMEATHSGSILFGDRISSPHGGARKSVLNKRTFYGSRSKRMINHFQTGGR